METYLITGHSKLLQTMEKQNTYDTLTITLEIDFRDGIITDVVSTLATEHSRNSLKQLLCGTCIWEGAGNLVEKLQSNFYGNTLEAVQTALTDALARVTTVPMLGVM